MKITNCFFMRHSRVQLRAFTGRPIGCHLDHPITPYLWWQLYGRALAIRSLIPLRGTSDDTAVRQPIPSHGIDRPSCGLLSWPLLYVVQQADAARGLLRLMHRPVNKTTAIPFESSLKRRHKHVADPLSTHIDTIGAAAATAVLLSPVFSQIDNKSAETRNDGHTNYCSSCLMFKALLILSTSSAVGLRIRFDQWRPQRLYRSLYCRCGPVYNPPHVTSASVVSWHFNISLRTFLFSCSFL